MWTRTRRWLGRWLLGPDLRYIRECRNRKWAQVCTLTRDHEAARTLQAVALGITLALEWLEPPPPKP
jgi:hypothetical protein